MFKGKHIVVILAALMAFGIYSSSAMAATIQNPTTVTVTEEATNEQHASAGTFIRFKVLSYVKAEGLTKEEIANAEECRVIGEGTDVPVYTNSGISVSGAFIEFEDTDREKACKVNGVWRLVRCGNVVHFEVRATIFHGQVLLVRSFAFKKIRVHIPLHVRVASPCGGPPAEAVAKIDQWVRYRAVVKAKGDVKIRIGGKIIDRVKAHVRAGATCKKTTTTTTVTEEKPGPPCSTCSKVPTCTERPEQEKCKPIVEVETINDMEASVNGHHHTRYICWEVKPGAESSLSTSETGLHVEYGETLGSAEYRGGAEFCQLYESPAEEVVEEYYAWARDVNTQAYGQSKTKVFWVEIVPF